MRCVPLIASVLLTAGPLAGAPPAPAPVAAPPDAAEQAQTLDAPPRDMPKAWFGVFIEDALDGGIQVIDVVPGGPAARAGLTRGDVLVRANGADLANIADLRRATVKLQPGDHVTFTLLRGGTATGAAVVLGAPPPPGWAVPRAQAIPPAAGAGPGGEGIEVAEIPSELRVHLGASSVDGLLVMRVDPSSPFGKDVRAGDLVVKIDDTPLDSLARWEGLLAAPRAGPLKLTGLRERKPYVALITLASSSALPGREAQRRALEAEIRALEGRLADLQRKLAALASAP